MRSRRLVGVLLLIGSIALIGLGVARAMRSRASSDEPVTTAQVREFTEGIGEGFRTGDADRLVDTLHPNVRKIYGDQQCRTFFEQGEDPKYAFDVRGVRGPGRWIWAADDRKFDVEWAFEVAVQRTTSNAPEETLDVHVSLLAGKLVWFSDCGNPLAA